MRSSTASLIRKHLSGLRDRQAERERRRRSRNEETREFYHRFKYGKESPQKKKSNS